MTKDNIYYYAIRKQSTGQRRVHVWDSNGNKVYTSGAFINFDQAREDLEQYAKKIKARVQSSS